MWSLNKLAKLAQRVALATAPQVPAHAALAADLSAKVNIYSCKALSEACAQLHSCMCNGPWKRPCSR